MAWRLLGWWIPAGEKMEPMERWLCPPAVEVDYKQGESLHKIKGSDVTSVRETIVGGEVNSWLL